MYSEETLNKLLKEIKNDLDCKLMTTQSVFSKYINKLNAFKQHGFSYSRIYEHAQFGIGKSHFYNLLHKATKKATESSVSDIDTVEHKPTAVRTNNHAPNKNTSNHNIDLVEWKMIMSDISERLVRDIINKGYSKHDVEAWIREHKIPNSGALRRYFNAIKTNK